MTAGELKELLSKVNDEVPVVVLLEQGIHTLETIYCEVTGPTWNHPWKNEVLTLKLSLRNFTWPSYE